MYNDESNALHLLDKLYIEFLMLPDERKLLVIEALEMRFRNAANSERKKDKENYAETLRQQKES